MDLYKQATPLIKWKIPLEMQHVAQKEVCSFSIISFSSNIPDMHNLRPQFATEYQQLETRK
jgi:hypothetical protein